MCTIFTLLCPLWKILKMFIQFNNKFELIKSKKNKSYLLPIMKDMLVHLVLILLIKSQINIHHILFFLYELFYTQENSMQLPILLFQLKTISS